MNALPAVAIKTRSHSIQYIHCAQMRSNRLCDVLCYNLILFIEKEDLSKERYKLIALVERNEPLP